MYKRIYQNIKMFILCHRETMKLGSFYPTVDEARARLTQMGSIGASYGIIDVGETPYEKVDPKNFQFLHSFV